MSIRPTYTTMGQSSPASVASGGYYHFKRDPTWTPNDPRYQPVAVSGPAMCKADKAERLAEFAGYLKQGLTAQQAGRLVGIKPKTARTYEQELKERQREEDLGRTPQEITAELHAQIAGKSAEHAALVAEFERTDALRVRPSGGRDAHNTRLAAERDTRLRQYAALRASGIGKMQARRQMELSDSVGRRYEADFRLVSREATA